MTQMLIGLGRRDERQPTGRAEFALLLGVGVALAIVIRIALWPTPGLPGDLDQFVLWVHDLATAPFGNAYNQNISFPPVMVYIWGLLAAIEPAFRTVMTSADPAIRAIMKAPASIADLALGALIAWHLRATPRWAVIGAVAVLLHPAVIYVSAWWGQYESIYVLGGVVAYLLAVRAHSRWAAVALAVALLTKPQALPFVVPFGAWFLARDGWRSTAVTALVGAGTIVILWLPFVAAGGPAGYARNLGEYQGDIFSILSLRAWNLWWLVQEVWAGGQFVSDQTAIIGPISLRLVGYALALLGELAVFALVYRARTMKALALGLAAAVLVAFCLLTTMHERYAFGAVAFLPLAFPDRRALALTIAFGAVFAVNLLAAIPPSPEIGSLLSVSGPLSVMGSLVVLAVTASVVWLVARERQPGPFRSVDVRSSPA